MATITYTESLTQMTCGECGISYAVPEPWREQKKKDGSGWFCPNGHSRVYRESDIEIAKRELREEQRRLAQERQAHDQTKARAREAEANAANAIKKAKRLRTRSANGVCPCCHRTFSVLARHMATKHSGYDAQPTA